MTPSPSVIEPVHSWPSLTGKVSPPKTQRPAQAHSWRKFLRLLEGPKYAKLQTSRLVYGRNDGMRVDLIGAIHIGEKLYYQSLNARFKNYDALLYEKLELGSKSTEELDDIENVLSLQRWIKRKLNLELQVSQIDYQAENFIHADLDLTTLTAMQSSQGESFLKLMQSVQEALDSDSNPQATVSDHGSRADPSRAVGHLIYDEQGRRRNTLEIKLLLARQLQDIELIVSTIEGIQGTVVLKERNKYVMEMLRKHLDQGKKSIGIFYGAAHMIEIAYRLIHDLGFSLKRTYWYTAWDIAKEPRYSYPSTNAQSFS